MSTSSFLRSFLGDKNGNLSEDLHEAIKEIELLEDENEKLLVQVDELNTYKAISDDYDELVEQLRHLKDCADKILDPEWKIHVDSHTKSIVESVEDLISRA